MAGSFGMVAEEEGVGVTSAEVNGFTVAELRFPPGYIQPRFEPASPYLAVVLDGTLVKSFGQRAMQLAEAEAVAMPAGAAHEARFGARGARIVIVKAREAGADAAAGSLARLIHLRGHRLVWLAWRLTGELRADDRAAPLAAEGLALELLAAAGREARPADVRRPPAWLRAAEELLRARTGDCVGLRELADAVGVDPGHLARGFRSYRGLSVGEYARRARISWAAAQLAGTDTPLATIAIQAGFADQSHFTRHFRRRVGTTPARYRRETQRGDAEA